MDKADSNLIERILEKGPVEQRLCKCGHFQWWHRCESSMSPIPAACCAMHCNCQLFTEQKTKD